MARAGIRYSLVLPISLLRWQAPSRSEYCVCRCRCTKSARGISSPLSSALSPQPFPPHVSRLTPSAPYPFRLTSHAFRADGIRNHIVHSPIRQADDVGRLDLHEECRLTAAGVAPLPRGDPGVHDHRELLPV